MVDDVWRPEANITVGCLWLAMSRAGGERHSVIADAKEATGSLGTALARLPLLLLLPHRLQTSGGRAGSWHRSVARAGDCGRWHMFAGRSVCVVARTQKGVTPTARSGRYLSGPAV